MSWQHSLACADGSMGAGLVCRPQRHAGAERLLPLLCFAVRSLRGRPKLPPAAPPPPVRRTERQQRLAAILAQQSAMGLSRAAGTLDMFNELRAGRGGRGRGRGEAALLAGALLC